MRPVPLNDGDEDAVLLLPPRELRAFTEIAPRAWTRNSVVPFIVSGVRQATPRLARGTRDFVCSLMPWIRTYSLRIMARDLLAALVVVALLVPQGLSYGLLNGVNPGNGLYASIFPVFITGKDVGMCNM
jgi:hypothetical protein